MAGIADAVGDILVAIVIVDTHHDVVVIGVLEDRFVV